ncbi:MAG TPA: hypothetical protein VHZ74_08790 [Bryobacteraceae bacterium]|jgi:hypothetical protein|nr:hypothetical protein [Bryobacteraceae bacterium]
MKGLSRSAMFTVFIGLGIAVFAQTPGQRTPPAQQPNQGDPTPQADSGQPMTLTGCLMKGSAADQYAVTDNQSGEKFSFAAPDQLGRYLNQTVQLTGTVTVRGREKAFRPQSVKTISASCERTQ